MTVIGRFLAVFVATFLLVSCASEIKSLPKTTAFNSESEDALLMVGIQAEGFYSVAQGENAMVWWAYDEATNNFADREKDYIVVGRSKFDTWGWGGAGMHKHKFVIVRAKPGQYALHEIRLHESSYKIGLRTYLIELEGGVINYLGNYIIYGEIMDENLDHIARSGARWEFKYDHAGHDLAAAQEDILKYENISAEIRLIEPEKLKLD